jgi:hypothetical protein
MRTTRSVCARAVEGTTGDGGGIKCARRIRIRSGRGTAAASILWRCFHVLPCGRLARTGSFQRGVSLLTGRAYPGQALFWRAEVARRTVRARLNSAGAVRGLKCWRGPAESASFCPGAPRTPEPFRDFPRVSAAPLFEALPPAWPCGRGEMGIGSGANVVGSPPTRVEVGRAAASFALGLRAASVYPGARGAEALCARMARARGLSLRQGASALAPARSSLPLPGGAGGEGVLFGCAARRRPPEGAGAS